MPDPIILVCYANQSHKYIDEKNLIHSTIESLADSSQLIRINAQTGTEVTSQLIVVLSVAHI